MKAKGYPAAGFFFGYLYEMDMIIIIRPAVKQDVYLMIPFI